MYEGGNLGENQGARPAQPGGGNGGRGSSPRTFDPYNRGQNQPQSAVGDPAGHFNSAEQGQQAITGPSPNPQQQRSRANSNSSPASNQQGGFSLFDNNAQQQSSRTSTSSPGESSGHQAKTSVAPTSAGVAPIGTRPAPQTQAANPALNKRSTTPLPSPLSYGFAPNEGSQTTSANNERSTSAASNPNPIPSPNPPAGSNKEAGVGMAWGSGSGAWGKNPLGVQASVWG